MWVPARLELTAADADVLAVAPPICALFGALPKSTRQRTVAGHRQADQRKAGDCHRPRSVGALGLDVRLAHSLPRAAVRMAVQESQTAPVGAGDLGGTKKIGALEACRTVDMALAFLRQDHLLDRGREPLPASARMPDSETQILLAIGSQQMLFEVPVDLGGDGSATRHGRVPPAAPH